MSTDKNFLTQVANRIAKPPQDTPDGLGESILTVAAGSFGFRSSTSREDLTQPTGFDPGAAALFESIVEAAYIVATADGVFDDTERAAFEDVVFEACHGLVHREQLESLVADLADELTEDGADARIDMLARSISKQDHQREVLRIAALLAHVSGDVSEVEREALQKMNKAFGLESEVVDAVITEARTALAEAKQAP